MTWTQIHAVDTMAAESANSGSVVGAAPRCAHLRRHKSEGWKNMREYRPRNASVGVEALINVSLSLALLLLMAAIPADCPHRHPQHGGVCV